MKILITGSNGFIGQEILHQALTVSDVDVIALSRGENRFHREEGYTYISADVCDEVEINTIIDKFRPDCVIHTVAMANVNECEKDPASCRLVNVESPRYLVTAAEKYNFHLIYLSTDFIFDGLNGPYDEQDLPNPLNEYGKSKLDAENLLRSSDCKWSIVRTILVYGMPHETGRSNLILWVKKTLEAKTEIKVVTDHFRMPTLVNDVAKACLSIASKGAEGVFHISSDELYSVYEIALHVADFWKLDSSLISPVLSSSFPSSVSRPAYTGFIIDKAKVEIDFRPRSLKEGLLEISRSLLT